MIEVTLLSLTMLLIAAYVFLPMGYSRLSPAEYPPQTVEVGDACADLERRAAEDTHPNFLNHLQNEIEAALFPRPTDSILLRHYHALVKAEVDIRLAAMPDS